VIRDGKAGRRGARSHKVTFTLDDILALKGLITKIRKFQYDKESQPQKTDKQFSGLPECWQNKRNKYKKNNQRKRTCFVSNSRCSSEYHIFHPAFPWRCVMWTVKILIFTNTRKNLSWLHRITPFVKSKPNKLI